MFAAACPLATGYSRRRNSDRAVSCGRDLDTDNVTRSEFVIGGDRPKLPVGFLPKKLIPQWSHSGSARLVRMLPTWREWLRSQAAPRRTSGKDLRSEMLAVLIRVHHRRRLSPPGGGGGAGACATTGFACALFGLCFLGVSLNFLVRSESAG